MGTWGDTGCFSFQASKNLNSGEGGAILSNNEELVEKCYAFHNNCRARQTASYNFTYLGSRGANLRLTEFQAGLLLSQMTRVEEQSKMREQNAQYLTQMLCGYPAFCPRASMKAARAMPITFTCSATNRSSLATCRGRNSEGAERGRNSLFQRLFALE